METAGHDSNGRSFSMEQTARWLEQGDVRSLRVGQSVVLLFGAVMLLLDLAAWFDIGFGVVAKSEGPFYILLLGGASLVVWQGLAITRGVRVSESLLVDDRAMLFKDTKGRLARLPWSQPGFALDIVDRRSVPVAKRNTKQASLVYVLNTRGVPLTGLTSEALQAVLRQARSHGLQVTGYSETPLEAPISHWIRIRQPRS